MAEQTIATATLTNPDFNLFLVDGVECIKATIIRKKGKRGQLRPVWQGKPCEACLMAFPLGIVINDDTVTWTAMLECKDGRKYALPYTDLLTAHNGSSKAIPLN